MAVIFDDVVPVRHLPKGDLRLLLLSNCRHLALSRGGKQRQWLITQRLDGPERVAPLEFERWQKGIGLCQLDKGLRRHAGPAPHVIDG
ncbi:hypothetical protein D3C87_1875750 [compost metagenome]